MSLDDLLGDEAKREHAVLAERASAARVRERMAAMLRDLSVQQRLQSLQADMIEDPGVGTAPPDAGAEVPDGGPYAIPMVPARRSSAVGDAAEARQATTVAV